MRTRFAVAILAAFAVGLAGCGGNDDEVVRDAAQQKYVDALVENGLNDADAPEGVTRDQMHCIAVPIIEVYGVDAFVEAGYTIEKLRDPETELDELPDPTPKQADELGKRLQACDVGALMASTLAEELGGAADAKARSCVSTKIERDDDVARAVAVGLTGHDTSTADARAFAQMAVDCLSFATVIVERSGLALSESEIACIDDRLRTSGPFVDAFAARLAGNDEVEGEAATEAAMRACLTPARLLELQAAARSQQ